MKRLSFLFISIFLSSVSVFCGELKKSSIYNGIRFDAAGKFNLKSKDSTYSAGAGTRLSLKGAGIRFYDFTPTLKFSEQFEVKKLQYSVTVDLKEFFSIPLALFGGTIGVSGAASKFNNPALSSSVSPLSSFLSVSPELSFSQPSVSSSEKPEGFAVLFAKSFERLKSLNLKAAFFYDRSEKGIGNFFVSFEPVQFSSIYFSFLGEVNQVKSESSSWFSDHPLFPQRKIFSGMIQTGFSSKNCRSCQIFNLYEKQDGFPAFTINSRNQIRTDFFSLLLEGFYSFQDETLVPASKFLSPVWEVKCVPAFKLYGPGNKFAVTYGAGFFLEDKKNSVFEKEELILKSEAAFQLKTGKTVNKFQFSGTNLILSSNDAFEKSVFRSAWSGFFSRKIISSAGLSINYSPETAVQKSSGGAKISASMSLPGCPQVKINSSLSVVTKKNEITQIRPEIKLVYRRKFKFFEISTALEVKFSII